MKTSPDSTGDLGQFIISELNKRGVVFSTIADLPRLPATWRMVTVKIAGEDKDVGVRAKGCSLDEVLDFCFSLLTPLRVHRPFSKDNDKSFWFSIDGEQGNFSRTDSGLVISLITIGVALTVAQSDQELFIGFTEHPTNSG